MVRILSNVVYVTLTSMSPATFAAVVVLMAISVSFAQSADPLRLPAAEARHVGTRLATTRAADDTVTYATGFLDRNQSIAFTVERPAGLYRVHIRYRASGSKGYDLKIDGLIYSGMFPKSPEFTDFDAGLIELPGGKIDLTIGGGWGHYDIAGLTLTPATADAPTPAPAGVLCNPAASPEARDLFRRLLSGYGQYTLSGVHEFADVEYVKQQVGHDVAILSRDLMDYTPSRIEHGSRPGRMTERVIESAKAGYTVTLCWHWNAPKDLIDKIETRPDGRTVDKRWYRGFYSEATTFDFSRALADPNGADYALLLRDIDAIAVELKKLQAAHVPVLWRPLHEAEGKWFWWGTRGPLAYRQLWTLLYDRLTHYHKLDNLIWVYTSAGEVDWYPGDDKVDVIGADAYPADNRDPLTGIWSTLRRSFGDRKPLTLSEVGMVPDVDRMRRHGVYWAYFCTWGGKLGPRGMAYGELRDRLASTAVHGLKPPNGK